MSTEEARPALEVLGAEGLGVDAEIPAFADAANSQPWVDSHRPGRVVFTDDLRARLEQYLPPAEYRAWAARQAERHGQVGALGVGMAFVARDGVRTAVISTTEDRGLTLALFGHEYLEAATDEREAALGFAGPNDQEAMHGRALWGEYVVERTRLDIAYELGWPESDLDRSFLTRSAADAERAGARTQAWAYSILALDYAKATGRADAGCASEQAELRAFVRTAIYNQTWSGYASVLRRVFNAPETDPDVHDRAVFDCWAAIWRARA